MRRRRLLRACLLIASVALACNQNGIAVSRARILATTLESMNGDSLKINDLVGPAESHLVLASGSQCQICIDDAFERAVMLQQQGTDAFLIIFHPQIEDVRGWSKFYPEIPIFRAVGEPQFMERGAFSLPMDVVVQKDGISRVDLVQPREYE